MSVPHDIASSLDRRECKVHWEQLCSNEEIWEWFENRKMPKSLHGKLTRPGVYRFLFPLDNKSESKSRCYIGQTKSLGGRIRDHLTMKEINIPEKVEIAETTLSTDKHAKKLSHRERAYCELYEKNKVFGALKNVQASIKNSVRLEELMIEGGYLLGVPVNQDSLQFPFARKMLENLELLRAQLDLVRIRGTAVRRFGVLNSPLPSRYTGILDNSVKLV